MKFIPPTIFGGIRVGVVVFYSQRTLVVMAPKRLMSLLRAMFWRLPWDKTSVLSSNMHSHNIDRRSLLKFGASAAAGIMLPACAGARAYQASTPRASGVLLPKVQVSNDRVIRSVAGLRPFRRSGFALRADRMGEKTVIHNYGHGGCGLTLSWGTAQLGVVLSPREPARKHPG